MVGLPGTWDPGPPRSRCYRPVSATFRPDLTVISAISHSLRPPSSICIVILLVFPLWRETGNSCLAGRRWRHIRQSELTLRPFRTLCTPFRRVPAGITLDDEGGSGRADGRPDVNNGHFPHSERSILAISSSQWQLSIVHTVREVAKWRWTCGLHCARCHRLSATFRTLCVESLFSR